MAADPSIFQQYLKPARSMADYASEMDVREMNQLEMAAKRQAVADEQSLRSAYQQSGGDQNKLMQLLTQTGQYKAAQGVQKSMLDTQKIQSDIEQTAAQTGKYRADTAKTAQETKYAAIAQHAQDIASIRTPQDIAAYMDSGIAKGIFPAEAREQMLQRASQYPTVEAFKQAAMQNALPVVERARIDAENARNKLTTETAIKTNAATVGATLAGQRSTAATAAARLNFDKQQPRGQVVQTDQGPMLVNPRDATATPVTVGGQSLGPNLKQIPQSVSKAIIENNAALRKVDQALAELDTYPDAFGPSNYLGDTIKQRTDPKGIKARALVADIGSLKIHDRSGAAVTASETPRLKPFIPSATDDAKTIRQKLELFQSEYNAIQNDINSTYSRDQGYRASRGGGGVIDFGSLK